MREREKKRDKVREWERESKKEVGGIEKERVIWSKEEKERKNRIILL